MNKRYRIIFSGRVQGVGFRYTAKRFADKYKVVGWVLNLPDGDVELEAQAEGEVLDNFLKDLQDEFRGYIRDYTIEELPPTTKYKDFQIRFY